MSARQVKVRVVCKPLSAGPPTGYRADVLIIDDYPWPITCLGGFPDEGLKQVGPPIFPDGSR